MQKHFSKSFESLNSSATFVPAPQKDDTRFFNRIRKGDLKAWIEEEFTCIERYRMTRLDQETYAVLSEADNNLLSRSKNLKFKKILDNPSYDPLWEDQSDETYLYIS